ncbi:MAG: peptidoglycan editing factor PgeF [Nitrospira sp.]|jgi:YfiH family protein|nr:peptidoglycan editing factor PgeF [Nitrospira sp.]
MVNAPVITVPAFAPARSGVRHFFGTRRHASALRLGTGTPVRAAGSSARAPWLLSVKQVHGTDALVVDRPLAEADRFDGGWDALVTDQPGTMVAVRTADCVPVLVHDARRRVVAAIHAGWRGAVAGIVPKTLALMQARFNADLDTLHVSIGPSAGVCCYEVDEPVLDQVRERFPWWEAVLRDHREGRARLDLKALIRRQVRDYGIAGERVTSVNVCTICHEDLFFSYRREGKVLGTMVSAIGLDPLR